MQELQMAKFWEFEKNPVFRGEYIETVLRTKDKDDQKAGSVMGFKMKDKNDNLHIVGASAIVENVMRDVEPGTFLRITFLGKTKSKTTGKPLNDFKIEKYDDQKEFLGDHSEEASESK